MTLSADNGQDLDRSRDPSRATARRATKWLALAATTLFAVAAAAPALLSTRLLQPVLSGLIARHVLVPVTFSSARVRWRGPLVLHDLSIASPASFGDAPLAIARTASLGLSFPALLLGDRPGSVTVEGLFLEVIENADEQTNLGQLLAQHHATPGAWRSNRVLSIAAANAAARITSAEAPDRSTLLSPLQVSLETGPLGIRACTFAATMDGGSATRGLEIHVSRDQDSGGSTSLEVRADDIPMKVLQPLVRAFYPAASLDGLAQGNASLRWSPSEFSCRAEGTLTRFLIQGTPLHDKPIHDTQMDVSGSFTVEKLEQRVRFDQFEVVTSCFGVDANGGLEVAADRFVGDLVLRASMEFSRTNRRIPPALGFIPRGFRLGGDAVLDLSLDSSGQLHADLNGEAGAIGVPSGVNIGLGEWRTRGLITWDRTARVVEVKDWIFDTYAGMFDGAVRVQMTDDQPWEFDGDVGFNGDCAKAMRLLSPLHPEVPLSLTGHGALRITGRAGPEETHLRATVRSDDLDVRVDYDTPQISDLYWVRGAPLDAALEARWPRHGDPLMGLSATFEARADKGWIRLDEMTDVRAKATMDDGVARLVELSMGGYDGGSLSATGTLSVGSGPPAIDVTAEIKGVRVERLLLDLLARPLPVFAATPNPFAIQTTCRGDGAVNLRGVGRTMTEWFQTMQGDAWVEIGEGTVEGSPVLSALDPEHAPTRWVGLSTQITLRPGEVHSNARLILPGRSPIRIVGVASPAGALDFRIPPEDLVPPSAVDALADLLEPDLFTIRGAANGPILRLPDETFYKLDDVGNMRENLMNLKHR